MVGISFRPFCGENVRIGNGCNAQYKMSGIQLFQKTGSSEYRMFRMLKLEWAYMFVPAGLQIRIRIGNGNVVAGKVKQEKGCAYLRSGVITQKEEARIQLQTEEFDLMGVVANLDEIEEVNANCILMANLQQASTSEIHKIVKDEIFPIVNQVDARVQNFKIQFLKEAAKFVQDFKSLAKEVDESLTKHKALELEIERLLRAVVSQDIMSIVQNNSVADTSNLQTELEHTKERFENCILKKENEYAKLWNDWYKKCEECKYDKISYDKAYIDMQQKIKRLQSQLEDLKGKCKDTPCVSDTLDPLSQKLENENVELEFQVLNYAKENAHLKTTYKNLLTLSL
ncbi:hypothetical protein Tco_0996878 [Tanacetum coccineum]